MTVLILLAVAVIVVLAVAIGRAARIKDELPEASSTTAVRRITLPSVPTPRSRRTSIGLHDANSWVGPSLIEAIDALMTGLSAPVTAKAIYRRLRNAGNTNRFSVRNVQSALMALATNHHTVRRVHASTGCRPRFLPMKMEARGEPSPSAVFSRAA